MNSPSLPAEGWTPPRERSAGPGAGRTAVLAAFLAVAAVIVAAFGLTPNASGQASVVPDFQLLDVNPNSPRYKQTVSPRDYRLQISAYYFGAAG